MGQQARKNGLQTVLHGLVLIGAAEGHQQAVALAQKGRDRAIGCSARDRWGRAIGAFGTGCKGKEDQSKTGSAPEKVNLFPKM